MDLTYFKSLPPPFAVVGMGVTGKAVVELLHALGVGDSQILTYDDKDPSAKFRDPLALMQQGPKTLLISPGVPLNTPWLQSAKKQGCRISSELTLAFSLLTTERVIAITGSIGKSTTTSLLGVGAQAMSASNFVGGNLGVPLAKYAVRVLNNSSSRAQWVILELSSYQLENFENLSCDFSAITYLTPNHLERYASLESYYQQKLTLLSKTKITAVMNSLGGDLKGRATGPSLVWVDRNSDILKSKNLLPCSMIGEYNKDNLSVAAKIAELSSWPEPAFAAMKKFSGLPHRLENLGERKGVRWINDSKATTIESVISATETVLETLPAQTTLILLLGGHDKNLPWDRLKKFKNTAELRFVFFGEFGESAKKIAGLEGPYFPKLGLALKSLHTITHPGDTVLLSPGGTSHDEFKNFEERGEFFRSFVSKD